MQESYAMVLKLNSEQNLEKKSSWSEKCHAFSKVHAAEMVELVDS